MEEKMGTVLMDGRVVDLERLSIVELKKLKKEMQNKEKELRREINKILEK